MLVANIRRGLAVVCRSFLGRGHMLALLAASLLLPAWTQAEHQGKIQILLLGDSTCIGSVCRKHDPQGPHLEDVIRMRLAEQKDLPPVNVINQGRDGEYIYGLLTKGHYDRDIARLPGIDFVLFRYGLNDGNKREKFETNFPEDIRGLIARLRKDFPQAKIIPMTVIPFGASRNMDRYNVPIRKVAAEEKLTVLDVGPAYVTELDRKGENALNYRRYLLDKVPDALRERAKPFVVGKPPMVEVMDTTLDAEFGKLPGWYADRHPNLAGYKVIGEETAKFLAPLLKDVKQPVGR